MGGGRQPHPWCCPQSTDFSAMLPCCLLSNPDLPLTGWCLIFLICETESVIVAPYRMPVRTEWISTWRVLRAIPGTWETSPTCQLFVLGNSEWTCLSLISPSVFWSDCWKISPWSHSFGYVILTSSRNRTLRESDESCGFFLQSGHIHICMQFCL